MAAKERKGKWACVGVKVHLRLGNKYIVISSFRCFSAFQVFLPTASEHHTIFETAVFG